MTARKHPPLLRLSVLTKTPYIITRYTKRGDLISASEKFECRDELLHVVAGLGVSDSALDEVAEALGMVRTDGDAA